MLGVGISLTGRGASGPPAPSTFVDLMAGTGLANLSIARASSGWAEDSAGFIQAFGSNAFRRTDKGLYVARASTNKIRNGNAAGAVAGTPGTAPTNWSFTSTSNGLTRTIVGTGTDGTTGLPYLDVRYAGTATAAGTYGISFESVSQVAAASGQTWTASMWIALVAGSLSGLSTAVLECAEYATGSRVAQTQVALAGITATPSRLVASRTFNNGATTHAVGRIFLQATNGAAIDATLRVAGSQLEQLPYATQIIPTTGAELTRAADDVSIASALLTDLQGAAGTVVLDVSKVQAASGVILGGSAGALLQRGAAGAETTIVAPDGTPLTATIGGGLRADLDTFKVGLAWSAGGRSLVAGGGAVASNASAIGARASAKLGQYSGSYGDLIVRRVSTWGSRLSDSELQGLTA